VFRDKTKFLEEKQAKIENLREDLWYECGNLRSRNNELLAENFELRTQIKYVSWKPTQLQIDIEKIQNPRLGYVLDEAYSHLHPIKGLGLPFKYHNSLK
jgi:hypothetical protein